MSGLTALCLRAPAASGAALIALTLLLGSGIARLSSEAGYRAFLGADHPAVVRLDQFAGRFGGGLPFAIVWSCAESEACDRVFDPASLRMAHAVARALEAVPGVVRVDGPATSPLLVRPAFGFPEARRLAPDGEPAHDLATLAERASQDSTWVGQIVSADGSAGGLVIHLASSEPEIGVQAFAAANLALEPFERDGFRFSRVGGPVEFVVAGAELERAMGEIVPVMLLLTGLALALLFGRLAPALVGLTGAGVAVLWTLGLPGWLGWPQNSLTQVLAPLVLVIGVCDVIHLLAGYGAELPRQTAASREECQRAMLAAVSRVGRPCLFTTLTTAAAFLSFLASDLESFARLGVVAASGVFAALLLSFSLVPILAVRVPARWMVSAPASAAWERGLGVVSRLGPRAARPILALSVLAAVFGAAGLVQLEIDARFEDLYGEQSQVVQWAQAAERQLRAAETLEIALELPPGVRVDQREALANVARIEALAELPELSRPLSVLTLLREMHRMLYGSELDLGAEADPARPGQLLRLLRQEDPGLADLFVDRAGGALRISFQAGKIPQATLRVLLEKVDVQLSTALDDGYRAWATGPLTTIGAMIDEIRHTQLASFATAGVLVLGLIALFFRSPSTGLMALVPTVFPVLLTLGAMGWLGLALDVGSAMVAAVVLGLAVDDAIHLLDAYRVRRAAGDIAPLALAASVRRVGRALVTTSLALSLGFSALALSPWQTVASFGSITAIAVLGALAANLLLLPALLVAFARDESTRVS